MSKISFGIKTAPHHSSYQDMLGVWKQADQNPLIEHAWLFDHFAPIHGDLDAPCLEGWSTLAAFATQTSRVHIGLMVTGNTYRHPAVLAHIAATVDVISNGRLILGIGAGWNEYEHASMGIPLYAPAERVHRLDEACQIIKQLFTQHLTTFEGRYYQLKEARCEPKPIQKPYPPLLIGGGGEKLMLRVVAKHADIWNFPPGGTVEELEHKLGVLRQHCEAVGRDFSEITISVQPKAVRDYDNLKPLASQVQQFVELGATHVVIGLNPPYPDDAVQRIVDNVFAKVTA